MIFVHPLDVHESPDQGQSLPLKDSSGFDEVSRLGGEPFAELVEMVDECVRVLGVFSSGFDQDFHFQDIQRELTLCVGLVCLQRHQSFVVIPNCIV